MTRYITLAWERGGIDPHDCQSVTAKFITLAREWLRARGHPMPWAYVLETGRKYGAHSHVLLHVPPELDPLFRPMPRRWARHLLGGRYASGVVMAEGLRFRRAAESNPDAHWGELQGKVHYMLKTAPAALESELGMTGWGHEEWGQTCLTYGKRAGVWQHRRGRLK